MSSQGGDRRVRESDRQTKGVAPPRLVYSKGFVPGDLQPPQPLMRSRAKSMASSSSASSKKSQIDLEAEDKIADLELQIEDEVTELESQLSITKLKLTTNNQKRGKALETPEEHQSEEEKTVLKELEKENEELQFSIATMESKIKSLRSKLTRHRDAIRRKAEIRKQQVDIEEQEQDFGSSDEELLREQEANHPDDPDEFEDVRRWQQNIERDNSPDVHPVPVDKDSMMMQLMQAQISLMQQQASQSPSTPARIVTTSLDKDLPPFSGKPEDWPIFYNEFIRTTSKYKFEPVENAVRLRKSLKGAAKEAVIGLLDDPDSVPEVIKILKNRFGRNEFIIEALIEKAKAVKSPETGKPESIIQFGTAVQHLVARIRSLKEDRYLNDISLLKTLVKKLPVQIAEQWITWIEARPTAVENLEAFGEWLSGKVSRMERLHQPKIVEETEKTKGKKSCTVNVTIDKGKMICSVCDRKNHNTEDCYFLKKKSVEERWNIIKEKELCYSCLGADHTSKDCREAEKCKFDGCTSKHHPLLHRQRKQKVDGNTTKTDSDSNQKQNDGGQTSDGNMSTAVTSDILPIVPVVVSGPTGTSTIYALLDTGASCSIIEASVAEKLGIHGEKKQFRFNVFGGIREDKNSEVVNFQVAGSFRHAKFFNVDNARTVSKLGIPGCNYNVNAMKEKYPHLKCVKAKSLLNAVPQMIIGFSSYRLFAPRKIVESKYSDTAPVGFRSHLGWYICSGEIGRSSYFIQCEDDDMELNNMMKSFFSTEDFGVKLITHKTLEEKRSLELLERTTRRVAANRWETGLLWKSETSNMPESKSSAMKRLYTMERKMDSNQEFAEFCTKRFDEYIDKGYLIPAKQLSSTATTQDETGDGQSISEWCGLGSGRKTRELNKKWYLPWFFAYHPSKKPRLVFDAAAKSRGSSFNDFVSKGPDLLRPLAAVLMRFRRHQIGVTADIKEMFHQVHLKKEDRPSQTILFRGMDRSRPPTEYEMSVLFFGSASSPCSAIYTKLRNAEDFADVYPDAVKAIKFGEYMDDHLGGGDDVVETEKLVNQVIEIHGKGGFPILKWNASNKDVLRSIPEEMRAQGAITFEQKSEVQYEKTLGLFWNPEDDEFQFQLKFHRVPAEVLSGRRRPTKREVASLIMSIFDPLGFLTPLKIKALIILQNVWRSGIAWDDEISSHLMDAWDCWLKELSSIEDVRIPRKLSTVSLKDASVQIHTFCDASEEGFAAVVYFRVDTGGSIEVPFIAGKARVAPIKGLTIPNMELQAAVLGVRLTNSVKAAFMDDVKLNGETYWSDSKTVLCWLRSTKGRFKQFVSNRVGEILESTDVSFWRWIPSGENVADDATRANSKLEMSSNCRWLQGPSFLRMNELDWPTEDKKKTVEEVSDEELQYREIFQFAIVQEANFSLPELSRFSSWMRLIRATACVRAAGRRFKSEPFEVNQDDLDWAKTAWMKKSQRDNFAEELKALEKSEDVSKKSRIYSLSPGLNDEGLIVLRGRLKFADVSRSVKEPPILDPKHRYTDLLINWVHDKSGHFGQERVISQLRQQVWIVDCRQAVRRCSAKCRTCHLKKAKPSPPEMGQLPTGRLQSEYPFYNTGVDYFGPYYVAVGRSRQKRWGVLFTCLATRAVHLDLADSLDTSEWLNVLTRFVNFRGSPRHLWSDNGGNFLGGEKELKAAIAAWKKEDIANFTSSRDIQFHFNFPSNPHAGGSWERLVGSTKKILGILMKSQAPKETVLRTLFSEVMNILNSRPITYASPDPADEECLTPNHILNLRCAQGPSIAGVYNDDDRYRRSWRYAQHLADEFWRRWSQEYLPFLAKRQKWFARQTPLAEGDVVLVVDDQAPRNCWKRGVVVAVFPDKSGQVRRVEVKIAHVDSSDKEKKIKYSTLRRPAVKVCRLDVGSDLKTLCFREGEM